MWGVGVGFGYAAVSRPAGMADTDVSEHTFFARRVLHQLHAADAAHAFDFAVHVHGDTRRVIAPIFKAF